VKKGGLKLMISAGDASGDQHAAAVLRALRRRDPALQAFGLGGPALQAAGMRVDIDLVSRSVIGLVEVLKGLRFYGQALAQAERLAGEEGPDLVLLVDSSGFNLRLAERLHGRALVYYICPQVWASRAGRLKVMARTLRKALYTFPFEKKIYERAGIPSRFMGNPLLDAIPAGLLHRGSGDPSAVRQRRLRRQSGLPASGPLLGLLPGSRKQEIRSLLPVMLDSAQRVAGQLPGLRCVVIKAPSAPAELYLPVQAAQAQGLAVQVFESADAAKAYAARAACDAALVASGTATLETALLGVPFSVLYKVHPLTFAIGKRLVTLPYIGLANVVAGHQVVPEFLQGGLKPEAIAAETLAQLGDIKRRRAQRQGLAAGLRGLGSPGVAGRVAQELQQMAAHGRSHAKG
jgi:lipid-A-disaccharide synthase